MKKKNMVLAGILGMGLILGACGDINQKDTASVVEKTKVEKPSDSIQIEAFSVYDENSVKIEMGRKNNKFYLDVENNYGEPIYLATTYATASNGYAADMAILFDIANVQNNGLPTGSKASASFLIYDGKTYDEKVVMGINIISNETYQTIGSFEVTMDKEK